MSSSVLPLRLETKFYACTKLHAKLCLLYCDVDCTCSFRNVYRCFIFFLFLLLIQLFLLLLIQDKHFIECVRAHLFRLYLKLLQLKLCSCHTFILMSPRVTLETVWEKNPHFACLSTRVKTSFGTIACFIFL
jgi:hypothetical protein